MSQNDELSLVPEVLLKKLLKKKNLNHFTNYGPSANRISLTFLRLFSFIINIGNKYFSTKLFWVISVSQSD